MCSGDSAAETYLESRASGHPINSVQQAVETIFLNTFHEMMILDCLDIQTETSKGQVVPPALKLFQISGMLF